MSRRSMNRLPLRQRLERNVAGGRNALLVVIVFTAINIIMAFSGGDSYFLFSAAIPYYLVVNALYQCGMMPNDWYEAPKSEYIFADPSSLVAPTVFAVLILALFLVLFLLFKRNLGYMIASAALVLIDTVALVALFGVSDGLSDIVFHILILAYLVTAVVASVRLRTAPDDDAPAPQQPDGGSDDSSDFNY